MEFEVKKELKKDGWDRVTTLLYVSELRKCFICRHTFEYDDRAYIGEQTNRFFCSGCIEWECSKSHVTDMIYLYGILKPLSEYSGVEEIKQEAMF